MIQINQCQTKDFTLSTMEALPWDVLGTVYDSRVGENHIPHKLQPGCRSCFFYISLPVYLVTLTDTY